MGVERAALASETRRATNHTPATSNTTTSRPPSAIAHHSARLGDGVPRASAAGASEGRSGETLGSLTTGAASTAATVGSGPAPIASVGTSPAASGPVRGSPRAAGTSDGMAPRDTAQGTAVSSRNRASWMALRSAAAISPAVRYRSSGSLASALSTTNSTDSGISGFTNRGNLSGSVTCLSTTARGVSAS